MSYLLPTRPFAEQDFYLEEFRAKSLFIVLRAEDLQATADVESLATVCRYLVANDTRVIFLIETIRSAQQNDGKSDPIQTLSARIAQVANIPPLHPVPLSLEAEENVLENVFLENIFLEALWNALRTAPVCVGLRPTEKIEPPKSGALTEPAADKTQPLPLLTLAQRLAVRLKVHKLIILNPDDGMAADNKKISFMNEAVLDELLRQGEAEWSGLGRHRPLLQSVRSALEGGVASVSLCTPSSLAQELFTYEGAGTLFTLTDYCQVETLGLDDFSEVERLIQRGEREGYLKPRSLRETTQLLLHGYGARLGASAKQLAGFCALLPYPSDNAGEIVGLYTITRFQGEGIGGRLVSTVVEKAQAADLAYLFACTLQGGAQRLFERYGFHRVDPACTPPTKWHNYDPSRKDKIAVYRRDL